MKNKFSYGMLIALAVVLTAPAGAQLALAPYSEDFEALDAGNGDALGWFGPGGFSAFGIGYCGTTCFDDGNPGDFWYTYGPFAAPNGTPGFSSVAVGQGGSSQGEQQVVVYNDYNNTGHIDGAQLIEAIFYREWIVGAGDVGSTWKFSFDAKKGDLLAPTTARAFIKTIDPANNFALTNFVILDTTDLPETWARYSLSLSIDESLAGQLFQIGFDTVATNYDPSGNVYDNINLEETFCNTDPTVTYNGCDSGVPNADLGDCTMNDALDACALSAGHHGQFVACVAQLVNDWANDGLIGARDKGRIISCAAGNREAIFYRIRSDVRDVTSGQDGSSPQMWGEGSSRSGSNRTPRGRRR